MYSSHFGPRKALQVNPMTPISAIFEAAKSLRGNCTPNQKLACFLLYLKIINTFLKNNICTL